MKSVFIGLALLFSLTECLASDRFRTMNRPIDALNSKISVTSRNKLKSIHWEKIVEYDQLDELIPNGFCDELSQMSLANRTKISKEIFGEIVPEQYLCYGAAELISCTLRDSCEPGLLVPLMYQIDRINSLYPFPPKPACDTVNYSPGLVDTPKAISTNNWYRRVVEWQTECLIEGTIVKYIYNHQSGWRRE